MLKKFFRGKVFAYICIALALFSFTAVTLQNVMWEKYLFPHYPEFTNNNVSGANYFAYFTILTNCFCAVWLLLYAIGTLALPRLRKWITKPAIQGGLTVYIFITGFVYFGILQWFIGLYPSNLWFFNLVDYFDHLIIPTLFTTMWLAGISDEKLSKNVVWFYLIYPALYFVFSVIRGAIIGWYAYPFINSHELWEILFPSKEYASVTANIILTAVIAVLIVLFYFIGRLAVYLHNERISKACKKNTEKAAEPPAVDTDIAA